MPENTTKELKPCPFCGKYALFFCNADKRIKITCYNDCVAMPAQYDAGYTSKEQAIKAWNTRVKWKQLINN